MGSMKIALVHDHLTQEGGAEKVLRAFQEIWPQAPTYTLVYDQARVGSLFAGHEIRTSWLQRLPGAVRYNRLLLPWMPLATESYRLNDFDVVLSSSSAFAKGVVTQAATLHLCYCHTPTRYLWTDTHEYVAELPYPRLAKRLLLSPLLSRLRQWDYLAAQRPDGFIANSKTVADRIAKFYRRSATVVHPPVATNQFSLAPSVGRYFLTGGRLVSYKRFDLAVRAFNRLGLPLVIFGDGPQRRSLQAIAKPNVTFAGRVGEAELAELYRRCVAFLHPQVEDFGITAVEAMASGRPVVAYAAGGALESVVAGTTGVFFGEQSWEALADAVVRLQPERFDPAAIRAYAQQFGLEQFTVQIRSLVETEYAAFRAQKIECRA